MVAHIFFKPVIDEFEWHHMGRRSVRLVTRAQGQMYLENQS